MELNHYFKSTKIEKNKTEGLQQYTHTEIDQYGAIVRGVMRSTCPTAAFSTTTQQQQHKNNNKNNDSMDTRRLVATTEPKLAQQPARWASKKRTESTHHIRLLQKRDGDGRGTLDELISPRRDMWDVLPSVGLLEEPWCIFQKRKRSSLAGCPSQLLWLAIVWLNMFCVIVLF